jgi:hypothetical protein
MLTGRLQGKFIPIRPETEQAAVRDVTEITLMPKLFSGKRIAEVNFDKRYLNGQKGIAQGNTCVRETTRVQDDEFDAVGLGLLDPVNEFMFGIALKAGEVMPQPFGAFNTAFFDVGEARRAVNIGFTRTQQVQVGPINEQKSGHSEVFTAR